MKRALAIVGLVGAIGVSLVGCKSTGTATSASSPTTGVASTQPGQGVTDSEIKIGVTYTDLSAIKDIVHIDHGDYASAFQDLADDINASGGINGRKLVLVDGPVNPVGTGSATTVCTKLTEDDKVFAVIGNVQADVTSCYVTDHNSTLVGGQQTTEAVVAAKAPWFAYDATLDHVAQQTIQGAAAAGTFTGKKVAIVSLPAQAGLVSDTLNPALQDAGADVVERAVIDAPPTDQAAALTQATTFADKFKSDGVDVVVAVGDAFLTFAKALEQTSYRPALVATDSNVVQTYLVGRSDYSVLPGLVAGGPPGQAAGWADPALQSCIAKIKKAEPDRQINDPTTATADTPNTWVSVEVACQAMTLFEAIAQNAGSTLNNDTFRAAGYSLGTINIPAKDGPSNFTQDAPSGNPPVFLGQWDSSTNKLVVSTTPIS